MTVMKHRVGSVSKRGSVLETSRTRNCCIFIRASSSSSSAAAASIPSSSSSYCSSTSNVRRKTLKTLQYGENNRRRLNKKNTNKFREECITKVNAAAGGADTNGMSVEGTKTGGSPLYAVWKFTRPHTIRGTILGSVALTSRVLLENVEAIRLALIPRALCGVIALLCANAFIVGINQIYDVKIDKVNKPYLPIAAGELSTSTAWILILSLGGIGLTIVHLLFGQHIAMLYTLSLIIGVVYSVPPLRLKQRPLPAMGCIVLCRGFLLNYGVNDATSAGKSAVKNMNLSLS